MSDVVETAIQEYVRTDLMGGGGDDLDASTPLLELGILDSFSMLRLVEWLEKRFSVQLDSSDVVAENFATIASIAAVVRKNQG